jgi:hypothetical protein
MGAHSIGSRVDLNKKMQATPYWSPAEALLDGIGPFGTTQDECPRSPSCLFHSGSEQAGGRDSFSEW